MREYLFRGKRCDNGEWIEGSLIIYDWDNRYISIYSTEEEMAFRVDPETVGQYTGLTDKNGRKIFEGDVVKMSFEGTSRWYDGDYGVDFDGYKIGVVTFGGYGTFLKVSQGELYEDDEKVEDWKPARRSRLAAYRSEVIGNAHDNPDLLKDVESCG